MHKCSETPRQGGLTTKVKTNQKKKIKKQKVAARDWYANRRVVTPPVTAEHP